MKRINVLPHPTVEQNYSLMFIINFQAKISETWGLGKAHQTLS